MKKLFRKILVGVFALACTTTYAQVKGNYQVIPLPQSIKLTEEAPFKLNKKTVIAYTEGNQLLKKNAEFLADYIKEATNNTLKVKAIANGTELKNAIILSLDSSVENNEGYTLTTTARNIRIAGKTANGVFYGVQTLRKSIPAEVKDKFVEMPSAVISDYPRFGYRGMMLDVGRHYFPVSFVKEYIDLLALHNMNTFHWHLTEDQGWRIEIKKYPKLTEIGSKRDCTVIGHNSGKYDGTPYGGFFTQEEAKEIVKYAAERYITVIPEIDLPGHMLGALAAYPELGCTGGPYKVATQWGIFDDVLCIGNPKTIQFLKDVMDEIMEIFPSKYIHIGGDEAPRVRWKSCPKCQALVKAEGLKADEKHTAEDRLQSYCTAQIEKYLNLHGRKIIGWDEILEGDVAPNATVMSWRGMKGGIEAAKLNHDVIMTPTDFAYFDYYQTKDTKNEPIAIGGFLPLEKVYSFEPVPAQLTEDQKKHILGGQANLWTEYIPTTKQVEYMVLPRMAAMSEVLWTNPELKDYKQFKNDLTRMIQIYKRDNRNVCPHGIECECTKKSCTKCQK